MTPTAADIERIVREVLERCGGQQDATPRTATTPTAAPSVTLPAGQLKIDNRVISLNDITDRLEGIRELVVPRGAVLTPSARDLLRQQGVTVQSAEELTTNGAPSQLIVAAAETKFDPRTLAQLLRRTGMTVKTIRSAGLSQAIAELVTHVGQAVAILCTRQTALSLCLANRRAGIRAVLAQGAATDEAVDAVAANVLVVDPSQHKISELERLAESFGRRGPRDCPLPWRAELG